MNNNLKRAALVLMALSGLSACQKTACDYTLTGNRNTDANLLAACLDILDPTPVARMPTTGKATYNGFLGGDIYSASIAGGDSIIGDARVTANFGTGNVTGTMSNLDSANQGSLGGKLNLTGATISDNLILGVNVNGALTGYGAETITFATSGLGAFAGVDAQGVAIATTGTVTFSGPTAAGTADLGIIAFD